MALIHFQSKDRSVFVLWSYNSVKRKHGFENFKRNVKERLSRKSEHRSGPADPRSKGTLLCLQHVLTTLICHKAKHHRNSSNHYIITELVPITMSLKHCKIEVSSEKWNKKKSHYTSRDFYLNIASLFPENL